MATDLDAGIVDQRVRKLVEVYGSRLAARGRDDEARRRSNAFCALCVSVLLGIDLDDAVDTLTDGGEDGGVDAIHLTHLGDDEMVVTLFQAKYEQTKLTGKAAFPASEIPKLTETIRTIFDPNAPLEKMSSIEARVEEIRSLIRDGTYPSVRVVLCNNGPRWGTDGDARIQAAALPPEQVQWEHLDHRRLVSLLRGQKSIDATLDFRGTAHVEDLHFRRVFVGKVAVTTIAELMDAHGDGLIDRNIRRFLGLSNRVNSKIAKTLRSTAERPNFYFYNNGLTMICRKLSYNELQRGDYRVKVENLQIINGGQTCKTIQRVLGEHDDPTAFADTFVMVRLYQLDEDDDQRIGHAITYATNNQTPIELQDLRANDEIQQRLALDLRQLGYTYKTKRDNQPADDTTISSTEAAIAVLSIWRKQPHLARFAESRLFDRYYGRIFNRSLNGAQIVLATRIFKDVSSRLDEIAQDPKLGNIRFLAYATHYTAMLCGLFLRVQMEKSSSISAVDHRSLSAFFEQWAREQERFVLLALESLDKGLQQIGVDAASKSTSLQRIAAQFRRSDLLTAIVAYHAGHPPLG